MKKGLKIFGITLASIVGLLLVTICVALWIVFTPARLTPIVNKQLPRFVTCDARVERVELTFFSSFPRFGVRIDGLSAINPVPVGTPTDTLVQCDRVNAAIDIRAFLKEDKLMLSDLVLQDGSVCLYTDSLGRMNYDIVKPSPDETPDEEGGMTIEVIDLDDLKLKNIDVRYVDESTRMDASLARLSARVKARYGDDAMTADLRVEPVQVSFAFDDEAYLTDATVSMDIAAAIDLKNMAATLTTGTVHINDLELNVGGDVRMNLLTGIETNLWYKFASWPVASVLDLVPPSLRHYTKGISVDGMLSSNGTVTGVYSDTGMPVVDLNLLFEQGSVTYPALLPYPLHDVHADIGLHTDLKTDSISYATINRLEAKTPNSSLRVTGRVDNLLVDPLAAVSANVSANLADARPFIPRDMDLVAKGHVAGSLSARARMSHLTTMALDRMQVSGNLHVTNLSAAYDTIHVAMPRATLNFALPNRKSTSQHTKFASLSLAAEKLDASAGASTTAGITNMNLTVETSDIRDTQAVPAVTANFSFADFSAAMGGMTVDVTSPSGIVTLEPGRRNAATQRLHLVYGSNAIATRMDDLSATVGRTDINAGITYDESRADLWSQLSPRGNISVQNTTVNTPSLNYPVEVPTLAMEFTPRRFNIQKARVLLNESDFSLDGTVDDIRPYIQGRAPLRAEFNFNSPITNVTQLLALTSGIGSEEATVDNRAAASAPPDGAAPAPAPGESGRDDNGEGTSEVFGEKPIEPETLTEPYMVPKGVDITLHANIGRALWYSGKPEPNVFSNIHGDLRVADGKLYVSPEISFSSPATDGQIMFIYETPRRDHLFAGVSLHLNNIEIQELLGFIPDLDELMPMLRSFNGRGEFHLSAGGYMNSNYRFKLSTLRGAGSVAATDLTLKDKEVFDQVAFLLKYKEEGMLRVDSLSAEFTILRDKVDVYPFLFVMDRYKAVISGRHGIDMDFDYNVSLVQSPIPFRMAVDISSKKGKMKFKLAKSKYPDFYRPHRHNVVENQELELRQMIRESLTSASKEE